MYAHTYICVCMYNYRIASTIKFSARMLKQDRPAPDTVLPPKDTSFPPY